MHQFATGDRVTDQNLDQLDRLADTAQIASSPDQMQNWLLAVISSIEMLPPSIARQLKGSFHLGDLHYRWSEEQRKREWAKLIEGLSRDIDQLASEGVTATASDRPRSRGEAIAALCDELESEGLGTPHFNVLVRRLSSIAVHDAAADAQTLEQLAMRKRVDPYEIIRTISHLRHLAGQMFSMRD